MELALGTSVDQPCAALMAAPVASNRVCTTQLSIGGLCLRITSSNPRDVLLNAELQTFSSGMGAADVEINVHWLPEIPPAPEHIGFDSGTTWRFYDRGDHLQFDFGDPITRGPVYKRLLIDRGFRRAKLWMARNYFDQLSCSPDPLGYPLDELLITHRLTQERGIELHGVGMVGPNDANNLFIGHSGAGKSTTARLWTSLHEVKILSDDRIIVRESPARELQPGDDPRKIFMYGTPWHGEACFALPDRAPLHRIFILEQGHGNVLTRLTKSQAVGELFARAFVPFHRHEYIDSALSFLEQLAESVPCYRYSFEPDARAVEKILQFHD
jgi:hypothetical protein